MNESIILLKNDSGNLFENEYKNVGLDVWQLIADNSSLLTTILLKRCSKFLSKIKTKEKERVCEELRKMCGIEKSEELLLKLQEFKLIISGSFVLSCILGWEFEYGDIDIYVNKSSLTFLNEHTKYKKIVSYHNEKCGKKSNLDCYLEKIAKFEKYMGFLDSEFRINNYKTKLNKTLSLIIVNKNINEIVKNYDLDVCKNYFDGDKIYIKNIEKIIKREDTLIPNEIMLNHYDKEFELFTAQKRIGYFKKYNIGFRENDKKIMEEKIKKRVDKYTKRGFKIKNE